MRFFAVLAVASLHCGYQVLGSAIPRASTATVVEVRDLPSACFDLCNNSKLEHDNTGTCGPAYKEYYEACKSCASSHGGDMKGWPWLC